MRWSERPAAWFLIFDDIPPSTRIDALSHQPSLISFSLDPTTARYDSADST